MLLNVSKSLFLLFYVRVNIIWQKVTLRSVSADLLGILTDQLSFRYCFLESFSFSEIHLWHCKLKRLAYLWKSQNICARLIKGHKYCTSPVQRRYILAPHRKFNNVKDGDKWFIVQEQGHIVQLFNFSQCYNKIGCLHTKKNT